MIVFHYGRTALKVGALDLQISVAKLDQKAKLLLVSVGGGAAVFVAIMAITSLSGMDFILAVSISLLVFAVTGTLTALKVRIFNYSDKIEVRLNSVFRKSIHKSEVLSLDVGPCTGHAEGYGYRIMGKGGRGFLVGGRTVEIRAKNHVLIASADDPRGVIVKIGIFDETISDKL